MEASTNQPRAPQEQHQPPPAPPAPLELDREPGPAQVAAALSQTAHDYGQKISEVASQAKDYVSDKVSVVGDKFKELQNADLGELAENAKEYARQKPGQALLISAAAGLLLGLIIRGRR